VPTFQKRLDAHALQSVIDADVEMQ